MQYYNQFEKFDPLFGEVPGYPIAHLPDIAWRARMFLRNRTAAQIIAIAKSIDLLIDEHFDAILEKEIDRLRSILIRSVSEKSESQKDDEYYYALQFFEFVENNDGGGEWVFNENYYGDLDVPTSGNTTETDALKECASCLDDFCKTIELGSDSCKPFELFSVLALWLLSDAINYLNPFSIGEGIKRVFTDLDERFRRMGFETIGSNINISLAVAEALKAMDAVCYAEHLYEVERMREIHQLEMTKTHQEYLDEKNKHEEESRKKRTERSRELNRQRHRNTYEAKALVLDEWIKQPNRFSSADKAGIHFASWLEEKGLGHEPRTVAGWIREFAKEKGFRFR